MLRSHWSEYFNNIFFFSFLLSSFPFLPIAPLYSVLTLFISTRCHQPLYLTFSLSRSPPQRPNLRAPPSLYYLLPSADVGLCLCFSICCGQWACVCVCGSGLVFSDFWAFWHNWWNFRGVFCLQCFPMWLLCPGSEDRVKEKERQSWSRKTKMQVKIEWR